MAWKKYFTPATNGDGLSPVSGYNSSARPGPARTNYSSYLPDVYTGSPNRIDRYSQYEVMDSDPEINAALDILAEFCTQKLKDGKSPFTVNWRSKATNSEVRILGEYLQQWNKLQLFDTRIFRIVRNTFKYGDSFFIRDPETQKWCWIDATKIVKVIVNESDGKKPEQYVIKDLAPNFESLVATQITPNVNPRQTGGAMPNGASFGGNAGTAQSTNSSNRWGLSETEHAVSAEHVIHLSLSEGLDNNYPFGNSLLENIFKVYKQKELLEDAILIYRIQRAPERRIFHIDVGNMPAHLAMAFVERVKNEIHQRRIPSQTGGGCFAMDTRVPLLDGRILSIADLALEFEQGKENWAYSCNPETREMVPGIISWAGVTQKAAKVIELTLDNGEKIICTPEHKFPIVGKGKTEAKDIVTNEDSLISLASDINQVNKVVSIMELDAPIEVGTLTIDGDEINHNFHTFAIEQGVYTFNSNVIDSAYNPMCLDLSTKIPLLDGRVLSLSDIITEFEQGRQNWIYSCDPSTGKVMPGVVDWAGVTRRNTNTIKITLDNGEILIVTPDHKIPVFGKGFVEAQDLIPSDRLISFITTGDDYQQIWDHATNEWIWTHKMVGGFFKDKKKHQEFTYLEENCHEPKTTIHYKDGNTLNNDPRNIGYMGEDDHTLYHYTRQKSFWQTVSTMDGEAASEIAHIINKWDTISDKEKLSSFYDMRKEITYTVDGHANFNNLELTEKEINPTTKIVKIEKVENRDVGTITVDGKERWHSHHTFAIASGIFVKNSINEDYFFPMTADGRGSKVDTLPGGCFAMETSVSLLDGRELSIREIEEEMNAGKELWTYSCEPKTGKIVPGLISWAGVTHKSAKVMKLTLDNGETIICTPCHKFPQYDSEFKRAGEFIIGDSLIPLYRKKESVIGNNVYEEFFDNADKTWKFTHRAVGDYLKDTVVKYEVHDETISNGKYEVRHHKNFNRFDNSPTNLCFMSSSDHLAYHKTSIHRLHEHNKNIKDNFPETHAEYCKKVSDGLKKSWATLTDEDRTIRVKLITDSWTKLSDEDYTNRCMQSSENVKSYVARLSPGDREIRAQNSRNAFKIGNRRFNYLMDNDPAFRKDVIDKRMEYWTEDNRKARGEMFAKVGNQYRESDAGRKYLTEMASLQTVTYSHAMLKEVINLIKGKSSHECDITAVITALNKNQQLLSELCELNKTKKVRNWQISDGFKASGIRSMVKRFGYKNWSDFRKKESIHNHRIVNIEYLEDEIEVGTLTIDGDEIYHKHHTFALSCGIMCFNSSLGEISDLQFFTNKLFRGLRIPSSYLPTGADDSQANFNDGRVGTAYIQELRFNKYCERLQSLITHVFDEEFKLYMDSRGVNIDSSLFELQFNPPMNFASSRQASLDTERINTFNTMQQIPYMSKRFALKRFLGLTDEEVADNERLWGEESGKGQPTHTDSAGELRSAGLSAAGIEGDLGMAGNLDMPPEMEDGLPPDGNETPNVAPPAQ